MLARLSGARCRLAYGLADALPLTISCFSKIQIGFTFLVPAHLGSPGKGSLNGCVCPSIRLSATSRYCIETTGRIELLFGKKASFILSHALCYKDIWVSINSGTSLLNFISNSGLGKFRCCKSIALSTKLVVVDGRAC